MLRLTFGAALLLLAASGAHALGFGRGVTSTTLGQPLDFSAQLASDGDESPALECVAAEVRSGDAKVAPEKVRATIENGRAAGDRHVRVTTRTRVDEPVVTVDVTVGCTSRMSRRFVAFVDPPMLRLASAQQDEFTPQRVDSQVAPLLDIVNASTSRRPGTGERRAAPRSANARADAAARTTPGRRLAGASTVQREASPVARLAGERKAPRADLHASAAPAARSGPRLQLDAALPVLPALATASAPLPTSAIATQVASTGIGAAASSAGADAPDDAEVALAAERARIEGLENSLARLHEETQAQQKTLAAVQARLRDAESERYANGLVYLLAIALIFVAVVAGGFWALRPRQLAKARWFEAQGRLHGAAVQPPVEAEPQSPRVSQPPSGWNEGPQSILPVTAPASIGGLEVTTVLAPQSHYARLAQQEASANSPLGAPHGGAASIDGLADLEQQAEFFAVLGQEDAAVALLDGHLRHQAGTSPLPYLHLLDLHRRRGHRGAFERARIEHGARFAALAPEWDSAPGGERALEDHAQSIANLQALWATPPEAMRMLETLVARPSANDAMFDLAAYRDLLLLYSVARDLATPPEAGDGSIDLYLPLDDAPTVPLPRDAGGAAVDLDVSGWPDMPEEELVIRRRRAG